MTVEQKIITVIDDNSDMTTLLTTLLEMEKFKVIPLINTSKENITKSLQNQKTHVIIMDIHLHESNGLEILSYIKEDPFLKEIKVILTSGENLECEIIGCGSRLFLIKTIYAQKFTKTIIQTYKRKGGGVTINNTLQGPSWYCVDLHIHSPASTDFQQPNVTMLEILQRAETRGLDIIAITDHNTVSGIRKMNDQINQLKLLKELNRLLPEEKSILEEYERLFKKILVLPGFEFTATFGFHILAIFPPNKSVRELEHLLLSLKIAPELIDEGSQTVGATCDVLAAYKLINEAGGIVIAAHANSSNGVAMRGFNFGGQTKIAYTQDNNLHALEVTDLELPGNRTTSSFFNGTKPEYPRKMHCIQGSDSHRLSSDQNRRKVLGVGDRTTDIFLKRKRIFIINGCIYRK